MKHHASRLIPVVLMLAVVAGVVVAALPDGSSDDRGASATPPAADDARALLMQTAEAYRAAASFTDVMTVDVKATGMPPQNFELEYGFGEGGNSFVRLPGLSATALDGRVYVTRDDVPDRYIDIAQQGDLGSTLREVFGGDANLPAPFEMRANRGIDAYVAALGLGMIEGGQLTSAGTTTSEAGDTLRVLTITGGNGQGQVSIDPRTKLLHAMTVEAAMPGPAGAMDLTAKVRFAPRIRAAGERVVTFDAAGRSAVDSMQALAPRPVGAGEMAPDFALSNLDGETVTLSKLRGSVVVLDFWATWCGPCKRALPFLQQFDEWAKGSGHPVKVFAVNTMERAPTPDEIRKKATEYWTAQKYTMANLFDLDSAVVQAYGIQGIPTTIIVGTDGRVTSVHNGFRPDMVATLKNDVETALR